MAYNSILHNNHYSLHIIHEVQAICEPLFQKNQISTFVYARFFDSASTYICSSHPHLHAHHLNHGYIATPIIPENLLNNKFHYLLLPNQNDGFSQVIFDYKNYFDINFGINFYERYESYFDLFSFFTRDDSPSKINHMINHIDIFEKFKLYFKEKAAKLIAKSAQNEIILPQHMRPNLSGLKKDPRLKRHCFTTQGQKNYLTDRELEVIKYLAQGCTAKDAGKLSGLSPRTIENYLANIRTRLGIHKKHEIISAVGTAGLLT